MGIKQNKQNLYEGLYVMRATLSEDARKKAVDKVISFIENLQGSHKKTIDWGRKKMAYEVKGCREGHYLLIYFSLPTNAIDELIRQNNFHEDLLRFMHVLIEEVPEASEVFFKKIIQ